MKRFIQSLKRTLLLLVLAGFTAGAAAQGNYAPVTAADLPGAKLRFMQSSGGLTQGLRFRGPNALLSGPAGGVVGAALAIASGAEPFAFNGAANGSISRIVVHGPRFIVRGFNDCTHL